MKLIALTNFNWAHEGHSARQYSEGERIVTDDQELIRVATKEKWAQEGEWDDPVPAVDPTLPELLAARDTLVRREHELDEQVERVRVQAADNLAEAGRLAELRAELDNEVEQMRAEAAKLVSDRTAFEAAKAAAAVASAAPAPTGGKKQTAPAAQ